MQSYVFIKYILSCPMYFILAICQKLNRNPKAETTVVQKLNQGTIPENGLSSFSGVLFWFFFAQAKKNNNNFF
jgi:hypothetical protein